jgi:carboxymethylenebutenolidase
VVNKVPDAQVMADLDGAVKWAGANGGDTSKVAVTGFCWGGRITWLYAAQGPVKAGVAWYGRLVGTPNDLQPKNAIDLAANLRAPVLGLYGEKDGGIPLDSVEKMKAALATGNAASKASQFVVYPDAPHATTGRATARKPLMTASSAVWRGSRPMASVNTSRRN